MTPQEQYYFRVNRGRENRYYLALFLIVMFGGAIRKWVIDSSALGNIVLLIQMLLPFGILLFRSSAARNPLADFPILIPFYGYMVFHIIYPLQVTPYHGMLGFIVHGMFWTGIFFYFANRHLFNPAHFLPIIFYLVAGEVVLAFIQYALPNTHVLNKYATDVVENVAVVGDKVRVSGTFSYLSGYTAFLLFYPFFVWALIRKKYSTWIVAFATSFGMIASFMTGSRSGTALYIMFTGVLLLQSYNMSDLGRIFVRLMIPTMVVAALLLISGKITIFDQIQTAYNNFSDRVTANRDRGEERQRLLWDFNYFEGNRFKYPLLGIGIGSTYQGAVILFGVSPYAQEFGYVESEFVKVILEGGIILLFFKIALATIAVKKARLPSRFLKFLTWFALVYAAPIVYNVHNACFLLLGIMLVDNIVWRQEIEANYQARDHDTAALEKETEIPENG